MKTAPHSSAADTAQVNAERVRAALNRKQGEDPQKEGFIFGRYHDAWIATLGWLSPLPAAIVFLSFWTVLFVSLGLLRLLGHTPRTRPLRWLAVAALIATLLTGLAAFGAARVASYRIGVVVKDQAGLLDDVASAEPSMNLPEGLEVRVLDSRGGFTRVRLSSGREGFVSDRSIGIP
ncbi:MAG: hypothetical protein GXP54_09200 [Deltaproteobacteria bacterium]|nr:hypothetical protein [Deltaproteobacteria bacterium]